MEPVEKPAQNTQIAQPAKSTKILTCFGMLAMLICGIFAGILIGMATQTNVKCPQCNINPTTSVCPTATTQIVGCGSNENPSNLSYGQKYYHRIIVYGKNDQNQVVLVKLQLTRNQNGKGEYDHSYSGYLTVGDKDYMDWSTFNNASANILSNGFIKNVKVTAFPDASPRETYTFDLNFKGQLISLELSDINGDFISKSGLDGTRYVSAGTAKIAINGKIINGNVMIDQVYSYSDDNTIGDAGPEAGTVYRTNSIILWDADKNFYLIDTTDVDTVGSKYPTHRWILYKNASDKTMKKAFDAKLTFTNGKYHIEIPDLGSTVIDLKVDHDFAKNKGIVSGTIKVGTSASKSIGGHYVYLSGN